MFRDNTFFFLLFSFFPFFSLSRSFFFPSSPPPPVTIKRSYRALGLNLSGPPPPPSTTGRTGDGPPPRGFLTYYRYYYNKTSFMVLYYIVCTRYNIMRHLFFLPYLYTRHSCAQSIICVFVIRSDRDNAGSAERVRPRHAYYSGRARARNVV